MSKNIFSGGPTLGRGVGDIWDDFTSMVGGGETTNAATPMPSGGCQPGQIEFGSPSRCGSQADYDAYVKAQVAQAYGGDEKKATQYLQTTQYGQERNLGCSYPNTLANNDAGQPECFSPARFCDLMISRGGGYKGAIAVAKPKGGYTCFDCSGKEVPCPSGYPGISAPGSVKSTTPITPQPGPPDQAGVDLLPIVAIVGLLGVGGYLVYRKRQKAKGFSQNPYDFDAEED